MKRMFMKVELKKFKYEFRYYLDTLCCTNIHEKVAL